MTHKQKIEEIKTTMQYLINEGFVKQIGDKFRLKTEKELKNEVEKIAKK